MPQFESLSHLDRLVHEPARLAILTTLSGCRSSDFMSLLSATGLSRGNLSNHLIKLEQGGLILIAKGFTGRVPHTTVALTDDGLRAIDAYWIRLAALGEQAREWRKDRPEKE